MPDDAESFSWPDEGDPSERLLPREMGSILSVSGGLSESAGIEGLTGLTMDQFRAMLSGRIAELLDVNRPLLLSALYRIDVPEHRVRAVFEAGTVSGIPDALTDLIIERQLQKIQVRRRYRSA